MYDTSKHVLKFSLKQLGEYTMDGPKLYDAFMGYCPSINEFRKIIKWIGI
jgi:hypothetical protein